MTSHWSYSTTSENWTPEPRFMEKNQHESNIYKNPISSESSSSALRINVDMMNNTSSANEEQNRAPLDSNLAPSPSISSTKFNFDKITQLPTPVLNENKEAFSNFNFSPPNDQFLEVHKTRLSKNVGNSVSGRVISEYKPVPTIGRMDPMQQVDLPSKRFVSNPLNDVSNSPSSISNMPSPPDEVQSMYANQHFISQNWGKVYSFQDEIGTGNFSTVIVARNIECEEDLVAIKIISIPIDREDEIRNFKFFIRRELNILYNISHPCIIRLFDYNLNLSINKSEIESQKGVESESEIEDELALKRDYNNLKLNNDQLVFLNYCPGGNLFEFSYNHYKTNYTDLSYWLIIERIVSEIVVSVSYLHSNNIIHRDIKLENVLLKYKLDDLFKTLHSDKSFTNSLINLTDFGLSKKLKSSEDLLSTRCGSQDYISPELLMGLKYNGKLTDSWSVGVLIYGLIENRLPFDIPPLSTTSPSGVSPSVIKRKRARNNTAHRIAMIDWDWFQLPDLLHNPDVNDSIKSILRNLKRIVDSLLVRKDRRITASELLNHEEFKWISDCVPKHFLDF